MNKGFPDGYWTQIRQHINVFYDLVDGKNLDPYFFDVSLTGAIYPDFLCYDSIYTEN